MRTDPTPKPSNRQFLALLEWTKKDDVPEVERLKNEGASALNILVTTILSSRTTDKNSREASSRLFQFAPDREQLLKLDTGQIAGLIRQAGFYNQKSHQLFQLFRVLETKHNFLVPDSLEDLLSLPGVGVKTAQLVLAAAFNKPAICVDIHVLRISYRLGWTEQKEWTNANMLKVQHHLEQLFEEELWNQVNPVLVKHGQSTCRSRSPRCGECPLGSNATEPTCLYFSKMVSKA